MAHQWDAPAPSAGAGETAGKPDLAEFVDLIVTGKAASAVACVATLLEQGMTVEALCLDLLAPAARRLGGLWDEDLVYFTDVAVGLARLQNILTSVGAANPQAAPNLAGRRRALLISMPGEMHNFGLFMVADFFRRANWDVRAWPLIGDEELVAAIREEPLDIVGLSVSGAEQLDRAQAAIALIRKAARHGAPKILVGGPYFLQNPHAASEIGADATSPDGMSAVEAANELVRAGARAGWRKSA
jgi:methanogenic corrinoid protein MtbC1